METYKVKINNEKEIELPLLALDNGIKVAFFNLHGDSELTEYCGKALAKLAEGCEALITAESKGLQLTHVCARELGLKKYAVARKEKKIYMAENINTTYSPSIIGGKQSQLFISKHDADLLKGKRVGIVDDVLSTGASLKGLEKLVELSGGIIYKKLFVLAEGEAKDRKDVNFLGTIPLF